MIQSRKSWSQRKLVPPSEPSLNRPGVKRKTHGDKGDTLICAHGREQCSAQEGGLREEVVKGKKFQHTKRWLRQTMTNVKAVAELVATATLLVILFMSEQLMRPDSASWLRAKQAHKQLQTHVLCCPYHVVFVQGCSELGEHRLNVSLLLGLLLKWERYIVCKSLFPSLGCF